MPIFRGKQIVSSISDYKDSVRVALRSNLNIASLVTIIDGVTLQDQDRVLLVGQSASAQNGIYVWSSTTQRLTRASDADSALEINAGNKIYVEEGNINSKSNWILITTGAIDPGTTPLVFVKDSQIDDTLDGQRGSASKTLQITLNELGNVTEIQELDINVDGGEF
jgi:phage-related tail fiber protein